MISISEKVTGYPLALISWLSHQKSDMKYTIEPYKEKRSLNQNNFYWEIVTLISKGLNEPITYTHNYLLRKCEIYEMIDGSTILTLLPDTDAAERQSYYNDELHIKPVRGKAGEHKTAQGNFRWYKVLKGSRKYNVQEMTRLIDIALEQLESMDIMLPQEKAFMKALEEHERNHKCYTTTTV